jgi:hypothetical protein
MKKISQADAAITLGLACAVPVMAQDTLTSTSPTQATTTPSAQTMGAGPRR